MDSNRLNSIAAHRLKLNIEEVKIPVIVEHRTAMVPVYSQGKIQGKSVQEFFNNKELNFSNDELIHKASKIRQTQDATKLCVA